MFEISIKTRDSTIDLFLMVFITDWQFFSCSYENFFQSILRWWQRTSCKSGKCTRWIISLMVFVVVFFLFIIIIYVFFLSPFFYLIKIKQNSTICWEWSNQETTSTICFLSTCFVSEIKFQFISSLNGN